MRIKSVYLQLFLSLVWISLSLSADTLPGDFSAVHALLSDNAILPLYTVSDPNSSVHEIAISKNGDVLSVLDNQGKTLLSKDVGPGSVFGGFDFNQDGWIDLGIERSKPIPGEFCGTEPMFNRWLAFIDGKTGELFEGDDVISKIPDKCWTFGDIVYPTPQWIGLSVLYGNGTGEMKVSPYYAEDGWFFSFHNGKFYSDGAFVYPSTPRFDAAYPAARPNPYDFTHSYIPNSDVATGLVIPHGGQNRVVFFTSARVVQYKMGPFGPDQLLVDHPYLSGERKDIAGRNKGLVARDPLYKDNLILLAGASTISVLEDRLAHKIYFDPWAHIERHFTIYNFVTDQLNDRFYSYAHENNDSFLYNNRVVYPPNPFIPGKTGQPSRVAYNVYTNGHWYLHISKPGSTEDTYALKDRFLWDIRDVDEDNQAELVISPARYNTDPDVSGYYFPKWETSLYRWNESGQSLTNFKTFHGVLPMLVGRLKVAGKAAAADLIYPVLTTVKDGKPFLLTVDPLRKVKLQGLQDRSR